MVFKVFNIILINDEEDLDEKYDLIINEFLNDNYLRVSFEKEKIVNEIIFD